MESIDIRVNLTREDIYKFQKTFILKTTLPGLIIILGFCVLAFIATAISVVDRGNFSFNSLMPAIVPLFVILIIAIAIPVSLKKGSDNLLKTNKLLQKTQYYTIDNNGMEISTESSKATIRWDELYKAVETKDSFQFYLSERQSHIIPKRCMDENAEQLELMRTYIKNAPVPKKKRGLFRGFKFGCLAYAVLFVVILSVLMIYNLSNR